MNTVKKTISDHALAAKMIRKELKEAFPKIKFKVLSESYTGGSSVDVRWEDGPTEKEVKPLVTKYKSGYFDGQRDIYVYNNDSSNPSVKYLFLDRDYSDDVMNEAFNFSVNYYYRCKDCKSLSDYIENYGQCRDFILTKLRNCELFSGFNVKDFESANHH